MQPDLSQLKKQAKDKHHENKKYFDKLKSKPPNDLDRQMEQLHEEEFRKTDCLSCANCCKTTGPLFTNVDVERIAKHLKLKSAEFQQKYLRVDEENDLVLQTVPCVFLDAENYCLIYDVRPKACREYPHTNRKKFHQIANLTLQNVAICPAAYNIVEAMKRKMPK